MLELEQTGFSTIMLDGVQFPDQTSQAYYGTSELTSLSKPNVLKKEFVGDIKSSLKENTRLILTMPRPVGFWNKNRAVRRKPCNSLAPTSPRRYSMPSTLGSRAESRTT